MFRPSFPRTFVAALVLALVGLLRAALSAAEPASPVQNLLFAADDPADLRARLLAHADSVSADALDAGEAWYWAGVSWERAGHTDSALVAFGRARALRGNLEETLAEIDLRIARRSAGDLDSAAALAARLAAQPLGRLTDEVRLRDAWIRTQRGDAAALSPILDARRSPLFRPHAGIARRPLWAWRFAPLALAAGDGDAAWRLASPLVADTRGRDPEVTRLARAASVGRPIGTDYDHWQQSAILRADTTELAGLVGLGARLLTVKAEDGAALAAWYLPGPREAPIAVVTAPIEGEALVACDSLIVQLRRGGLAVVLLDPRGVRRSASATEPAALLRTDGQDGTQRRLARDLSVTLSVAARAAGTASPRGLAVGVGPAAMAAVLASADDPRLLAVLLAGPEIAPTERGWLRATLARSGTPAFFESGPENVFENLAIERIVAELPPTQTRVADSRMPGHGAALFRADAAEGGRVTAWLAGILKRPRATPPSRPR